MTDLCALLRFFSSPTECQLRLLPEIPRDRGVADYFLSIDTNCLLLLNRALREEALFDEQEDVQAYWRRIGAELSEDAYTRLREIACFCDLLRSALDADNLWNQRSLANRQEWSLLRRLCRECIDLLFPSAENDDRATRAVLLRIAKKSQTAEPGATDNPDSAQRLREDY